MSVFPATIDVEASATDAVQTLDLLRVHHLMVVERGELLGVVCGCDLDSLASADSVLSRTRVPAPTIGPDEPIERAGRALRSCKIGCLPVLADDGRLVGLVTRRDLRAAGALLDELVGERCAHCGAGLRPGAPRCPDALALCDACEAREHAAERRSEVPAAVVAKSA